MAEGAFTGGKLNYWPIDTGGRHAKLPGEGPKFQEKGGPVIQQTLNKLEWNDASLRAACEALNPGADAGKMTLATLTWTRKVTTRRQWFEKLAEDVAHPMGVALAANRAQGTFGRQISPGSARMPTVFSRRPSAGSKCPRATCGRRARLSIQELMRRRQPPWACKWEPLRMQSLMGILP